MSTESKPETELKTPKSLAFLNWAINRIESRATTTAEKANNHELISKITFILVLGMSYDLLGDRVISLVGLFL